MLIFRVPRSIWPQKDREMRLARMLDEKGISRYALAKRTGTRFEVIDRWYNGNVEKMDLDILARICYVLECDVSDILVYKNK